MNKAFKVVFNKARGAYMAVNEVTKSVQKGAAVAAVIVVTSVGSIAEAATYQLWNTESPP